MDNLITNVENAYWAQEQEMNDNVWLILQGVMIDTLSVDGNSTYKLCRMGRANLHREGTIPTFLKYDILRIAKRKRVT